MNNEKMKNELDEIKNELISLYLLIKPKKVEDVFQINLSYIFIIILAKSNIRSKYFTIRAR